MSILQQIELITEGETELKLFNMWEEKTITIKGRIIEPVEFKSIKIRVYGFSIKEKIAPKGVYYNHHETWHDDNGHSHVRASVMGPSTTFPIRNGKLIHGTWQQVVFVELDTRSRNRKLIVHIVGE